MNRMLMFAAMLLSAVLAAGQTPILRFTATTDNVSGAPDSIRIDVQRWSTDAERDQLVSAWTSPASSTRGGRGGRGAAADPAPDPAAVENDAANGGRGAAGRGGRGGRGARGGNAGAPEAPPPTPENSLTAALATAPVLGHLWSSEVAGYSLRYAVRLVEPDGGERVILITDRRLGAWNDLWKPAGAGPATNYEFSAIELRLNSKGEGVGKLSLTGKINVDSPAKTIALENYPGLPVILKNVRRK